MKFKDNYGNRPAPYEGEYNSGESRVQFAGYRPNNVEIANLIMSGERFARHRMTSDVISENQERLDVEMAMAIDGMDDFDKIDFAKREAFRIAKERNYLHKKKVEDDKKSEPGNPTIDEPGKPKKEDET